MKIRGREFRSPLLRIRTMLALVAAVALAIEGTMMGFRWHEYDSMYRTAVAEERDCRDSIAETEVTEAEVKRSFPYVPGSLSMPGLDREIQKSLAEIRATRDEMQVVAGWLAGTAKRYDDARRHPWRKIEAEAPPAHVMKIIAGGQRP